MSRGGKILILVFLSFASAFAFATAQKGGYRELALFLACTTVGLALGAVATALSRGDSRRR